MFYITSKSSKKFTKFFYHTTTNKRKPPDELGHLKMGGRGAFKVGSLNKKDIDYVY